MKSFNCAILACLFLAATVRADEPAVLLRWKLNPGDVVKIQIEAETTTTTTSPDTKVERHQESTAEWIFEATAVDANGTAQLAVHVARFRWNERSPQGNLELDTAKAGEKDLSQDQRATELAKILPQLKFAGQMSTSGEMLQCTLEAESETLVRSNPTARFLASRLTPESLLQTFKNLVPPLPQKRVVPGDQWTDELVVTKDGQKQKMQMMHTYRGQVQREGRSLDKIDTIAKTDFTDFTQALAARGVQITSIDQDGTATSFFDRDAGLWVANDISQTMSVVGKGGNMEIRQNEHTSVQVRMSKLK